MAQIPALFLPKRGADDKKTSMKKPPLKQKQKKEPSKMATLFQGSMNGNEKTSATA